jgi:hypothetical protein
VDETGSPTMSSRRLRGQSWRRAPPLKCGWFHPEERRGATGVALFPAVTKSYELVRAEGVEPSRAFWTLRIFVPLRLSPPTPGGGFVAWTIPSPAGAIRGRCCPSSLYTFPARCRCVRDMLTGLGSGLPSPASARPGLRVPRIWAVLHRRFPRRALKFLLKSVASAGSATPAWPLFIIGHTEGKRRPFLSPRHRRGGASRRPSSSAWPAGC